MSWFTHHPEVVSTEMEEGAVLLHMETRTYYSLNDVALEIWRGLESVRGPEQLAETLLRTFEGETGRAREAIASFLIRLEGERLIVAAESGSAAPARSGPAAGESRKPFADPELIKHDEPLHEIPMTPFDPQLPLAE